MTANALPTRSRPIKICQPDSRKRPPISPFPGPNPTGSIYAPWARRKMCNSQERGQSHGHTPRILLIPCCLPWTLLLICERQWLDMYALSCRPINSGHFKRARDFNFELSRIGRQPIYFVCSSVPTRSRVLGNAHQRGPQCCSASRDPAVNVGFIVISY